jgi:hypothetical protein
MKKPLMNTLLATTLAVLTCSANLLGQNKSVYTTLVAAKCKVTALNNGMPGNATTRCPGVGGFKLDVYLDDDRNSVGVVFPSKKVTGLDLWNYFANFSELSDKAEWRLKGKRPVALIVRLNVSDKGDGKRGTSYLVVSKVSGTTACVTDILKPGRGQNARARRLADSSAGRQCRKPDNR